MDMGLGGLQELVMDREAWHARFMESQRVGHDWATELNWGHYPYFKRWQEYTEELHKKYRNDPDNHSSRLTHLEPDILECEVKCTLGNITMNKTSEGDGVPVELFQILNMMLLKCYT